MAVTDSFPRKYDPAMYDLALGIILKEWAK